MPKLHWLLITTLLLGLPKISAGQPNIIHIMVDDAGTGDFTHSWADSPIHTPNLDQLASDGMRFTQAYTGAANCAPSRSSLMTGLHGGHTYMRINSGSNSLRDADVTIAEVLKSAGYATGGYGKWGLGAPGSPGAPELQGFDDFVGYYDQRHAHYHFPDRIFDAGTPLLIPENANFNEPETGLIPNDRVHAHTIVFDRMQQFVRANSQSGTPFYAWGAWTPPHRRSTINESAAEPGGYYDLYANNEDWDDFDKIQAAFVTWIDDQVGQLRATLADPNGDGDTSDSVLENTVIIFTSDNGGWQSAHNWDRNIETRDGQTVDLRGAKEGYYEGGVRTPMIAFWPGTIEGGTTSDQPVAFYDYMQTFADLAGVTQVPSNDGVSFAPTLTGQGTQAERDGLYFEGYAYDAGRVPNQIGRLGDWKIIRRAGSIEIFDLSTDPSETTNRYNDPAIQEIQGQLISYITRNHVPMSSQLALVPPDVGTGRAERDGIVTQAIRPAEQTRAWHVDGSGDPRNFTGAVQDEAEGIALYLDDLHQLYDVTLDLTRAGQAAPLLELTLKGQSGFTYLQGAIDTAALTVGNSTSTSVQLGYVGDSPTQEQLAADLGSPFTLQLSYAGDAGQLQFDHITLQGKAPVIGAPAALGDLDGDGTVGAADWLIFRDNLYSDLRMYPVGEQRARGDLTGDGQNDQYDFVLFKQIYEGLHGEGSLSAISAVPEPAGIWQAVALAMLGCSVCAVRRTWLRCS
ncbi:sulfatase-like hydrolase/transferase [Aeoliella mucimassa]|uniref:Choline-sulfatase n=1 Tax=Aeoliella mucimassa TaxID=2527972 RepID=A0A518AQ64_9BACT|nr:sulfatase-like hydrolase/transferase [Aeoliella mucimassa]QDU56858.1 Choline-sulfatase [Aeoliella mucimassa]